MGLYRFTTIQHCSPQETKQEILWLGKGTAGVVPSIHIQTRF
jgi:hypothetical protein